MTTRQYIGARYIPKFADPVQWSASNAYEYLTMVQNAGETFMSKQNVPIGATLPDISQGEESNEFWVHMSNWNAQVEQYRQEVLQYNSRISTVENDLPLTGFDSVNTVKKAIDDNAALLPSTDFDSVNTVKKAIDDNAALLPAGDFDSVNTVKKAIDGINANIGWTKIKELELFGKTAIFEFTGSRYVEDFTYDESRNLYYIGMSDGSVISANNNFTIIADTPSVIPEAFASIDYNPDKDVIYGSANNSYVINPASMSVSETIATTNGERLVYDAEQGKLLSFRGNASGIATINERDDSTFEILSTKTISYDSTYTITQGGCADNGKIFTSNQEQIIEIDYVSEKANTSWVVGDYRGRIEPEGFCVVNSELMQIANQYNVSNKSHVYRYGYASAENFLEDYTDWRFEHNTVMFRGGTAIEENDDLDSYLINGNYYTPSNAVAASLTHAPIEKTFLLKVLTAYGIGNSLKQVATRCEAPFDEYQRFYDSSSSSFGDWVRTNTNYRNFDLSANEVYTFDMVSDICLIASARGTDVYVGLANYWSDTVATILSSSPRITVSKSASSSSVTITNNVGGLTPVMVIS